MSMMTKAREAVERAVSMVGRQARADLGDVRFLAVSLAAFGVAIAIGTEFTRETGNAAAIWPANGILCAALLNVPRVGTRVALIAIGALVNFVVMRLLGDVPVACVSFAVINGSEVFLTYWLVKRFCPMPLNFAFGRNLALFCIIAGFLGPILPSIAGATVIHTLYGADFVTVLKTWFFSDALGLLIVVPTFFLIWEKDEFAAHARSSLEIMALYGALLVMSIAVFSQSHFPLLFLVQAVIVRIAFRLGPAHTASAVILAATIAIGFTSAGMGPATLGGGSELHVRFEIVQLFILVAFYSALPAANAFADQTRLQKGLDSQIRARDALAEKLIESKQMLRTAINNMSVGLCMYDSDGRIVLRNDRFAEIYGLPPDLVTAGMSLKQVIELRIANGVFAGDSPEHYRAERFAPVLTEDFKLHHLNNGRSIAIWQRPLPAGGWVTTQEDITETRRIEKRLAFLAHHDALTGLANRALLHERIELALTRVRRGDEVAVLFLDLDHFKSVNDTFGHATGDALLKVVSGRLRSGLRETDTIARLGGDEFAILLVGAKQPEGARVVARRIADLMSAPFEIDGQQIRIGTSIGIATAPHDTNSTSGLLKCADLALYKAKGEGRGGHRFFENAMDTMMAARQRLEQDLRQAMADHAFSLHYQPLLNLDTSTVTGFEALIRWQHKERGMISPAEFIPLAEETGLIVQIGQWVLKQACQDATAWPDHMSVAVNLSRAQFMSPDIVETIAAALRETGLRPQRLQLEITETCVVRNTQQAVQVLNELRAIGVETSMDDFGTGQSSLSSLRTLPFNKIKIDRAFVNDLTTSLEARAILKTIVSLATILGKSTTAEGIETAEQLDIVRASGCNEMQGYFFSRPKPLSELGHWINASDSKSSRAA